MVRYFGVPLCLGVIIGTISYAQGWPVSVGIVLSIATTTLVQIYGG